jgi:hypothetical protein
MKRCTKCGEAKRIDDFPISKYRKDGTPVSRPMCRECYNRYHVEWGIRNKEKRNRYFREWRAKEGERYKKQQRDRWHARLDAMSKEERLIYNAKQAKSVRERNMIMKNIVYDAYGGYKCACCGETEPLFLSIDHVNNDGAEHRRKLGIKGGTEIYRWLIKNDFPDGFQVLCYNCQQGKRLNNGVCPHQVRCNDYPVKGVGPSGSKRSASQEDDDIVCSA